MVVPPNARFVGALVFLLACDNGNLSTIDDPKKDDGEKLKLDAGTLTRDASAGEDASTPASDASIAPDAGEMEDCACPAVTACEEPIVDQPLFSKLDDRFLGQLLDLFACATQRIHLAMYETDLPCIADALIARLDADPDLEVDLVIDDDRCPRGTDGKLTCDFGRLEGRARVTIVDDMRSRYMHHKFAVADGAYLWTGSGNLTERSLCTDYNDAIVVSQPEIVAAYEAEFERMFTEREFGPHTREPPHTGGPYSVYFGPESPIADPPSWHLAMLQAIETASLSVDLMVFAWTHQDIADALIDAYGRGVLIRGVVAPSYANDPPAQSAIAAGLPIRTAPVHSKVIVVDGVRVITGTPNWSQNSWANDEASFWIDDPAIARAYEDRYDDVWSLSQPP